MLARSIRVLIVEDFEPFRRFVESILRKHPELQIVGEVSDGLEAVQRAEELQPDLIVLDVGLPTLTGIEAARRIRKLSPESKILFVSQETSARIVRGALAEGGNRYRTSFLDTRIDIGNTNYSIVARQLIEPGSPKCGCHNSALMQPRNVISWPILACLLLITAVSAFAADETGQPAPRFRAKTTTGDQFNSASVKGKVFCSSFGPHGASTARPKPRWSTRSPRNSPARA